jgi:hypothetical protein
MRRRVVLLAVLVLGAIGLVEVTGAPIDRAEAQTLPPTIAVAPFSDLVHRQEVRVAGFGFVPHAQLAISQCKAGVTNEYECDFSTSKFFQANQHGAFKRRIEVRRIMRTGGGETIDCAAAAGACVIGGGAYPSLSTGDTFPIHFDPDAPLPSPTVSVTPDANLLHKQEVAVEGSDFTPNATIAVQQCKTGEQDAYECGFGFNHTIANTDGDGSFSTTFVVARKFNGEGGAVDCAASAGACSVVASNIDDQIDEAEHAISFDPAGPVPPPPPVTVDPDEGLLHNQVVTVAGSGFPVESNVQVVQCLAGADPFVFPRPCASGSFTYFFTDETGALTVPIAVRRLITDTNGTQIDCATAPGTCEMVMASYEDPFAVGRVPLAFDASVPPPPPPTVKVRPRHHLTNGQVVTVSGSGFSANIQVGMAQCREGATDINGCDLSSVHYEFTDANGNFRTLFTVHARITVGGETVRCRSHKGACVVGAANVGDIAGEQGGEPIGFLTR